MMVTFMASYFPALSSTLSLYFYLLYIDTKPIEGEKRQLTKEIMGMSKALASRAAVRQVHAGPIMADTRLSLTWYHIDWSATVSLQWVSFQMKDKWWPGRRSDLLLTSSTAWMIAGAKYLPRYATEISSTEGSLYGINSPKVNSSPAAGLVNQITTKRYTRWTQHFFMIWWSPGDLMISSRTGDPGELAFPVVSLLSSPFEFLVTLTFNKASPKWSSSQRI